VLSSPLTAGGLVGAVVQPNIRDRAKPAKMKCHRGLFAIFIMDPFLSFCKYFPLVHLDKAIFPSVNNLGVLLPLLNPLLNLFRAGNTALGDLGAVNDDAGGKQYPLVNDG